MRLALTVLACDTHGADSPEIRIWFSAGTKVAKLFLKAPSDWKSRGQTTRAPVL
jgi:hypothetical protein